MTNIFSDKNETAAEVNTRNARNLAYQEALYAAVPDKAAHPGGDYDLPVTEEPPEVAPGVTTEAPTENIEPIAEPVVVEPEPEVEKPVEKPAPKAKSTKSTDQSNKS